MFVAPLRVITPLQGTLENPNGHATLATQVPQKMPWVLSSEGVEEWNPSPHEPLKPVNLADQIAATRRADAARKSAEPAKAEPPRKLTLAEQIAASRAKVSAAEPAEQVAAKRAARLAAKEAADARAEEEARAELAAEAKAKRVASDEANAQIEAELAREAAEAAAAGEVREMSLADRIAETRARERAERAAVAREAEAASQAAAAREVVREEGPAAVPAEIEAAIARGKVDEVAMRVSELSAGMMQMSPSDFRDLKRQLNRRAVEASRSLAAAQKIAQEAVPAA